MINRKEWKRSFKKKGRLQKKKIRRHNCSLGAGTSAASYDVSNPKTRRESKEI